MVGMGQGPDLFFYRNGREGALRPMGIVPTSLHIPAALKTTTSTHAASSSSSPPLAVDTHRGDKLHTNSASQTTASAGAERNERSAPGTARQQRLSSREGRRTIDDTPPPLLAATPGGEACETDSPFAMIADGASHLSARLDHEDEQEKKGSTSQAQLVMSGSGPLARPKAITNALSRAPGGRSLASSKSMPV